MEGKFAEIDERDYQQSNQMWNNSMSIYVVGKRPYYVYFNAHIKREWKAKGKWVVFSRDDGFCLVKFELQEDLEKILNR